MIKVVWGCCWFNEDVKTVIAFINKAIKEAYNKNIELLPVLFVANTGIDDDSISLVKESVNGIVIFKNTIDIYPNKNYGIYAIVNYANEIKSDYVSVVDPDWTIDECNKFLDTILSPIINDEADIVIPNIGYAAGRSNILVGRSILELFYPDYKDTIITPFPGVFAATTECVYKIVISDDYHFDWGGEWDLLSYSIKNKMRIVSKNVDVINVRHRSNNSKTNDSYQIWRAAFSNIEIIDRFYHLKKFKLNCSFNKEIYNEITNLSDIKDIISVLEENEINNTEAQILYMVFYPLSCLMDNKIYNYTIANNIGVPYDKSEIKDIANIAFMCVANCLKDKDPKIIVNNARSIKGGYFGEWDAENIKEAKKNILNQIKEIL